MPISPFLSRSKSLVSVDSYHREAPPRASTSSVFPSLHKLNTAQSNSTSAQPAGSSSNAPQNNAPLLSLRLSGTSFLDVVIRDRADKEPIYIVETVHESTTIYRLDASTERHTRVATIQWPGTITKSKIKSGRTIQMADGRWRDTEDFLKLGPLGSVA